MDEKKIEMNLQNDAPPTDGPSCGRPNNFKSWLANVWYHYKFYLIAGAFLIAVIVVSTVQIATKEEPDIEFLYAGGHRFLHSSVDGDIPPYLAAENALKGYASDYNGDGKLLVDLTDLYCPSEADIAAAKEAGEEIDASLYTSDRQTFLESIRYAQYYVCILSPELYSEYDTTANGSYFVPLSGYLPADSAVRLTDSGTGAYVDSTKLSKNTVFADLPEGTVIALRVIPTTAQFANRSDAEKAFHNAEAFIRRLFLSSK